QQLAQKRDPTVHHKEIFGRASDSAAVPTPSSVAEWWMRHKSLIYNALRAISPRNSLPRKVPSSSVLVSARALLLPDIPSPLPGPLQPAPLTRFPTRRVRLAPRGGVVIIPRALRRRRRRSRGTRASGAPALSAGFISEERQDAMDRTTLRVALLEMLEHNCGEPVAHFDEDMSLRADLGLDSVDLVTLVMEIQDRFCLRLAPAEMEQVQRAGELLDLLQARLSLRAAA